MESGCFRVTLVGMESNNVTEQAILAQAQQNKELLEKIYASTEKTRKMFLWTLIVSVVAFLLPLIGLLFAIPYFLSTYVPSITSLQLGL